MKAIVVLEYYRQFGFVSSVLAGFAFTFFGVLLPVSVTARAAALAAYLAVAGSIAFFLVTLGMTFAARRRGRPTARGCHACFGFGATDAAVVLFHGWNGPLTGEFRGRRLDSLALYGYCNHHSSRRRDVRNRPGSPSLCPLTDS